MEKAASHSYTVQTDKSVVKHNRSALVDLQEENPVTPKPNNHIHRSLRLQRCWVSINHMKKEANLLETHAPKLSGAEGMVLPLSH